MSKALVETVHTDCTVKWIDWLGSSRKYLRAKERFAEHATVRVKGAMAVIQLPDGEEVTKRLSTESFTFASADMRREQEKQREQRERQWSRLMSRFRAVSVRVKYETCDYFEWRDEAGRRDEAVEWTPVTHKWVAEKITASEFPYAERTITRLEEGTREVVRVGLHVGIRRVS